MMGSTLRRAALGLGLLLWSAVAMAQPLPGVNVEKLAPADVKALSDLMGQGMCPCEPKKNLLNCIQEEKCAEATALANFGADKFREGLGAEQVQEAVIQKFLMDHSPVHTFDLTNHPMKGDPDGDITIVEFADFQCPHCALMRNTLHELLKKSPKGVKIYFKQFPLGNTPHSQKAAQATTAAHKQGRFWPMHDLCFEHQHSLSDESYGRFASELGMNAKRLLEDMNSAEVIEQVRKDRDEGMAAGLTGTPTLFVNGQVYRGDSTVDALLAHFEKVREKAKQGKEGDKAKAP